MSRKEKEVRLLTRRWNDHGAEHSRSVTEIWKIEVLVLAIKSQLLLMGCEILGFCADGNAYSGLLGYDTA
jgi:hypothetical protein